MKSNFLAFGSALALLSAATNAFAADYNVSRPLPESLNGLTAYIVDYDTGAKIDSTQVASGMALFNGTVEAPVLARILVDGNRQGLLILEEGDILVDDNGLGTGTPLNDRLAKFTNDEQSKVAEMQALPKDASQEQIQKIVDEYNQLTTSQIPANADNPFGYYLFLQKAYEIDNLPEFDKKLAEYPAMASYQRIKTLRQGLINKQETSVGNQFKDFEITFEGETKRLNDFVGKGKYTLVDFWASWCGPCIRETRVIKELWNKYHDKGLDILGVAVWDEPDNTRRAIEQYQLPWPQILNAQTVPTDIYGISGIPCIILFDPQGKIVSRDKQDEDLVADVDAAMANVK